MSWSSGITILEFMLILNADWFLLLTHFFSFCKQTIQCHFEFKQILNTDLQQAVHGESYIYVCVKESPFI